jgi:Zn-dependent peptidase ImmA (M78 family)
MRLDKEVQEFIKRLQTSAPVDITGIAKVLGLKVWESSNFDRGIAGKLFREEKAPNSLVYNIVVRAQDPLVRKRFTVAHELAHYLLHRHLFATELIDDALYRSGLSTPIEAQANGLAAELLMPWHLLMPAIDIPIPSLAEMFQVSEQAMGIRLESGREIAIRGSVGRSRPMA